MKEIYLDNAATTPVYPEAVREMEKTMLKSYGNPSSIHNKGEEAFKLISDARKKIADDINCKPEEIIFTSGATESSSLALSFKSKKKKIFVSSIEHPSVMENAFKLEVGGYEIIKIPVDNLGIVDFNFLEKMIDANTFLVSVMHVNNIFGTIQDIGRIGKLCRKRGALFHTDAVQSFGKLKIDVKEMCVDMLSASAHKIGGPKGTGFLYIRTGLVLEPIIVGSGQERGMRSGTENVPGIVGFAKALEMQKKVNGNEIEKLRNNLILGLEKIGGKINGDKKKRIWNNVHVSFSGKDNEGIVLALSLKGIYVSTGSACESKKTKEDYILRAIGLNKREIDSGIRITLGKDTTEKDVERLLKEIKNLLR